VYIVINLLKKAFCANASSLLTTPISITMATMVTEACQLNAFASCGAIGVTSVPCDSHRGSLSFRGSGAYG